MTELNPHHTTIISVPSTPFCPRHHHISLCTVPQVYLLWPEWHFPSTLLALQLLRTLNWLPSALWVKTRALHMA